MFQKIKTLILSVSTVFMLSLSVAVPVTIYAAVPPPDIPANLCSGTSFDLGGTADPKCIQSGATADDFSTKLAKIINVISVIVGVIAVIMIIFGGFRYITSGGTSEKITSAKNTLLYAIIGLIIVALAQVIVKFVLNKATTP